MIPYRQLHFDQDVFGPEPVDEFRPERFTADKVRGEQLTRSDNWRPFGGGKTMCPGRYVAKRAVLLFIAMVLREYDLEAVGTRLEIQKGGGEKKRKEGEKFGVPEAEEGKPVLGIMSFKDDDDLLVRITRRRRV